MSDHTTSGTLIQELVPFALALKLMLHKLSMSLTAEALVRGSCIRGCQQCEDSAAAVNHFSQLALQSQ
jgi:hypothetical protein